MTTNKLDTMLHNIYADHTDGCDPDDCWSTEIVEAYIAERTKSLVEKVDRFEVIDHREYTDEPGRVFVSYAVKVDLSLQDDDRTLKVFVTDKALKSNERVSNE